MEVKKLTEYDMKRVITRARKEFGFIKRGHEEDYDPQLNNLEHAIYEVYSKNRISDLELRMVIEMIIYDLKSIIDNIDYNYQDIRGKKLIRFSKTLQKWFNPYVNDDLTLTEEGYNNLKAVFTLPIKCLLRIYDSIEFWHYRYGNDGYYRMLEEYVLPIFSVGDYTYILEYKYISSNN